MLKAIIQQVELAGEFLLGQKAGADTGQRLRSPALAACARSTEARRQIVRASRRDRPRQFRWKSDRSRGRERQRRCRVPPATGQGRSRKASCRCRQQRYCRCSQRAAPAFSPEKRGDHTKHFAVRAPAPKMAERGFIGFSPAASRAEPAHPACVAWLRHVWQTDLSPQAPCAGGLLDDSATR